MTHITYLRFCKSSRYLGVYIRDDKSKRDWLRERNMTWEKNIVTISKTKGKYSQESYDAVAHVIQSEWIFMQRVTWDMVNAFAVSEKMLWETFLLRLLFRRTKKISPIDY